MTIHWWIFLELSLLGRAVGFGASCLDWSAPWLFGSVRASVVRFLRCDGRVGVLFYSCVSVSNKSSKNQLFNC
jgi:uncharacterized membrane protein AbrB (regulator of aidB expression)